jgi:acyl carrier protein
MAAMPTSTEILDWLIATIARETHTVPEDIDPDKSVHALSIDSALVVSLTFDLEEQFGLELDLAAFYAHPSLRAFSEDLAKRTLEA